MSHFKAEMHQIRFRLELRLTPLRELAALPKPSNWILRMPASKGSGGREGKKIRGKGVKRG